MFVRHWVRYTHTACLPKSASWICFTLRQFRLYAFGIVGSISSLTGFVALHPSANPHLVLLAFTRLSISFRNFILKFLHSKNLVHIGTGFVTLTRRACQNPQKKALIFIRAILLIGREGQEVSQVGQCQCESLVLFSVLIVYFVFI